MVSQVESSGELSSRWSTSSFRSSRSGLSKYPRSRCLLGPEQTTQPAPTLQRLRKLLVELGLFGIAQYSTTTESEVEGFCGEAGSSWPGADDTTGAGVATVATTVGESRPQGIAKNSTTTEVSSVEAEPSWPRAYEMDSAVAAAAVKSAGDAQSLGIAKQSATAEPELRVAAELGLLGPEHVATAPPITRSSKIVKYIRIRVRIRRGLGARKGGVGIFLFNFVVCVFSLCLFGMCGSFQTCLCVCVQFGRLEGGACFLLKEFEAENFNELMLLLRGGLNCFSLFPSCSHRRANTGLNHVVRVSNHMQNEQGRGGKGKWDRLRNVEMLEECKGEERKWWSRCTFEFGSCVDETVQVVRSDMLDGLLGGESTRCFVQMGSLGSPWLHRDGGVSGWQERKAGDRSEDTEIKYVLRRSATEEWDTKRQDCRRTGAARRGCNVDCEPVKNWTHCQRDSFPQRSPEIRVTCRDADFSNISLGGNNRWQSVSIGTTSRRGGGCCSLGTAMSKSFPNIGVIT